MPVVAVVAIAFAGSTRRSDPRTWIGFGGGWFVATSAASQRYWQLPLRINASTVVPIGATTSIAITSRCMVLDTGGDGLGRVRIGRCSWRCFVALALLAGFLSHTVQARNIYL